MSRFDVKFGQDNLERRRVHLVDHRDYEDRVRALLIDMEQMSREHQNDLAEIRSKLSESNAIQDSLKEKVLRH